MKQNQITNPFKRTTTRSALSVLMLFVIMLVILFYLAQNYRNNLIDLRKNELKRKVELSLNIINPILQSLRNSEISREEALKQTVSLVRRMTYSSETMQNYIFMSSYEGIMLVQPLEPDKQDTYQLDMQDSYGNYLVRDLIRTATSPEGEGFVEYFYPPPGATTPGEKLSYVKGIPELGCYIGTGMFFDDINNLFKEYLIGPLIIIMVGLSSVYLLIIIYMRPLLRCFRFLLDAFHSISLNPDTKPEVPSNSFPQDSDEYEILSGFNLMIDNMNNSRISLRNSEKKYRYLYEESQGVRIIIDRSGMVYNVNDSFLRSLGFTDAEFCNNKLEKYACKSNKKKVETKVSDIFTDDYFEAFDFDLIDSEGKTRTILISDYLEVLEKNGRVLLTGVDITNRKIAERKAEMQKEQLIQADKLASLGVLVAGVAHEINNPNQFILSNAGLMQDVWNNTLPVLDEYYTENGDLIVNGLTYQEIKEQVPDYLSGIIEGARRIDKIVIDLKTLSRDDSSQTWSNVDINSTLESAVNLCRNMLNKATDNLDIELTQGLPLVLGNSQRLEQVFINLIQNSAQSLADKTKGIRIRTFLSDEGSVKIEFDDDGCGIPEYELKRVFDPFYTTKRETGGTGIGLSISKSIIDEHRGMLEFFSNPGYGTKAVLTLNPGLMKE